MADQLNISGDLESLDTSTEVTASQLLVQLKDIWRNERIAPELLPHHQDIVEVVLVLMKHMDRNVEKARVIQSEFYRCLIIKMELSRVRFMLSNYLRCRLEKLEKYTLYYRKLPMDRREVLMTPAEMAFVEKCQENTDKLIENSVLAYLPAGLPVLDSWQKTPLKPRVDGFVFAKPKEDLEGLILEGSSRGSSSVPVDLSKDMLYMLRYSSIQQHVIADKVILL